MATETKTAEATRSTPKPIADALHDIVANSVGMLDDLIATRRQLASQVIDVASAALTRVAWTAGAASAHTGGDTDTPTTPGGGA